jgi:hypothetical protein
MPFNGMPTAEEFARFRVTNADQSEVVRKRLYDYLLYPAAGSLQLNFFAQQVGTGITTAIGSAAGTSKTKLDTNMVMANTLPSGQEFMIESIEVQFDPGSVSTANTYTPINTYIFAAVAAQTVFAQLNDVNTLLQSGLVELKVLSKEYLSDTPIRAFPPKVRMAVDSASATNSATTGFMGTGSAKADGRPYYLEPPITLQPAVNFQLSITWPGLVATPSTFNGRLGVIFDGYEMRASQ